MTAPRLHEALHDLGDLQEPIRIDPDTYRRGRRDHRRARARAVVAAAALVVAGTGLAVTQVDDTSPPTPVSGEQAPALPTRLYAVPDRLAQHLGSDGYRWHSGLAADGLAIGTTAAVFPVNQGAVVAVSAVDGNYRGLDLPGFDEASYFRFGNVAAALSPDGSRLAYTWNPDVISGSRTDGYQPSGVRIADLQTGEVRSVRIPGGYGVFANGFSWSPDGRWLAYNLDVTTNPRGRVQGSRHFRVDRLDTSTGERVPVPLTRTDTGPAVSDRGEVVVVGNGPPATWLPGRTPAVRRFEGTGDEWTAAWSPGGQRVAAGSVQSGWFSVGDPDRLGLLTGTAAGASSGRTVRVLGWAGDREVALLHRTGGEQLSVSAVPAQRPRGGDGRTLVRVAPTIPAEGLSVATGLLDGPTREFPAPDWPTDWPRVGSWALAVGAGLLVTALWWRERRRRATA